MLCKNILEVLEIRFAYVPETLTEQIAGIHAIDKLQNLHRAAVTAVSLQEFEATLTQTASAMAPDSSQE